jgi:SAM-dependent methyltransferase
MGGGTGANLDYFGERISRLGKVYVLDLSHSLLEVAKQRIAAKGWTNVETVEADATTFQPPSGPVDVVTFSYSLTMIPDWFAAIQNALAILKPGGVIGVVDFYVSRKYASAGLARHGWMTHVLAHLVRDGQRLSVARPRALSAPSLRRPALRRAARQSSLHPPQPRAVLFVRGAEGRVGPLVAHYQWPSDIRLARNWSRYGAFMSRRPTVARPMAVRPTISAPWNSKCSCHPWRRGLSSSTTAPVDESIADRFGPFFGSSD